jgi:hypothetical protein
MMKNYVGVCVYETHLQERFLNTSGKVRLKIRKFRSIWYILPTLGLVYSKLSRSD